MVQIGTGRIWMRMKKGFKVLLIAVLILILLIAGGALYIERSLYVAPESPPPREGATYPSRPMVSDPVFHRTPFGSNLSERRGMFLEWAAAQPSENVSRDTIWAELVRLENGQVRFPDEILDWLLHFVEDRNDCADFTLAGLVRLYYTWSGSSILTSEQERAIRSTFLGFQYWFDEPNPNKSAMELWTENHQILVHSSEYLAGQLFQNETFTNNGMTGTERMMNARPKILRWIDWRVRTGFAEWDSPTYYPEDIAALLNLVDFAEDSEISIKATMLVDLILFDIAVDSFYGYYASSHGRAIEKNILSASGDPTVSIQALLWGLGRFQSTNNMGLVSLALSERYEPPPVIEAVALDMPEEMTNFERHSIPLSRDEAKKRNLSLDSTVDMDIWWGMGAMTHPLVIDQTKELLDRWQMWHYPDFRDLASLGDILDRLGLLSEASGWLEPDGNGVLTSEVNKVSYRTPDYMLSSAQDWRKGEMGYQQHIWQATLDPYAVVFATNPDSLKTGDLPGYWISNGRLPRTAQYGNVLVSLHRIESYKGALESQHHAFTHAYFPRWAFDEVVEIPVKDKGGWIFGRRGEGYVALYCDRPYYWQDQGIDADQEVIAVGRENVWICQMGRRAVDGEFSDFIANISRAALEVDGLEVRYEAPGMGDVEFDWSGPFKVNGGEVALREYLRWDNPYADVPFDSNEFLIEHQGMSLKLDFKENVRTING